VSTLYLQNLAGLDTAQVHLLEMFLNSIMGNKRQSIVKIIIKAICPILFVVVMLTSCSGSAPTPQSSSTNTFEAALSAAYTEFAETQTALPTGTPAATQFPTIPGASFTVVPPAADEQVYVDPEGWYSVNLPADMKSWDKPNVFTGGNRLFETDYLPYMSKPINLCLWLANVESNPKQSSVNWMPPCSVSGKTDDGYNVDFAIYENPLADPDHRFIYVKMGRLYSWVDTHIKHTVTWLKKAPETNSGTSLLTPKEASFWENPDTLLKDATITEYVLPPEAQAGPMVEMLTSFVPEEAKPDWEAIRKEYAALPKEPTVEEQLKSLGYQLKVVETQPNYRQQLFRNGRLLFDYVFNIPKVYKISTGSGPITAFVVNVMGTQYNGYFDSFLVVNDAIYAWDYASSDTANFAPILYQSELLWAKGTENRGVEIRRSNREVLFNFRTYFAAHLEVNSFRAWNDHWILTAGDFIVQDGEILNQKLGFQEMFAWSLIDEKPVYLFRKGARLGLSYDGKVLLLPYDDIPRGLCCGLGVNNPGVYDRSMRFFGKRDGVWYYVVAKFQ
jgi:hypothetical protein